MIGIFTPATIPLTSSAVLPNSVIIADPPPTLHTFLTGQPILISTEFAPRSSHFFAASRISEATAPKSCTAHGRSSGEVATNSNALRLFSSKDRALTRSVVAMPHPPISRTVRRKGKLVYPARGDKNNGVANSRSPIFSFTPSPRLFSTIVGHPPCFAQLGKKPSLFYPRNRRLESVWPLGKRATPLCPLPPRSFFQRVF